MSSKERKKESTSLHDQRKTRNSKHFQIQRLYNPVVKCMVYIGSGCLDFNSGSYTYYLSDLGQSTYCAVSLAVSWG